MALSNTERQVRYRHKVKTGELSRIDAKISPEIAIKLNYLAWHWHCTQAEALGRLLIETWEREGRPVPGGDGEGTALPGHAQGTSQDQEPPQKAEEGRGGVPASIPPGILRRPLHGLLRPKNAAPERRPLPAGRKRPRNGS